MALSHKPGRLSVMIMDRLKKKGEGEKPSDMTEDDDSEGDMGLESAAEDVISAVKAGDAAALAEALKDFYSMCS